MDGWCFIVKDLCLEGFHNCDVNAKCTSTPGSFNCHCKTGYEGNGITCTGTLINVLYYCIFTKNYKQFTL